MRRVTVAICAAATLATPAAARFAPPADTPLRIETVQESDDGSGVRRVTATHDVRFTRTPQGWRATLTLRREGLSDSGDALGAFARLQAVLVGRAVTVWLDRAGHVTGVENADAWWARLRAAIADVAGGSPARDRTRALLLAHHDAATPAQRVETLAGTLAALCAGAEAERRDGTRATTVPAGAFGAEAATQPAQERVVRDGAMVRIDLTATGPVAGPGGAAGSVSLHESREVVRGTGLVRAMRSVRETMVPLTGADRRLRTETRVRFDKVSQYLSANPPNP